MSKSAKCRALRHKCLEEIEHLRVQVKELEDEQDLPTTIHIGEAVMHGTEEVCMTARKWLRKQRKRIEKLESKLDYPHDEIHRLFEIKQTLSLQAATLLSENKRLRLQRDNYRRAMQSIQPIYPGALVDAVYKKLEKQEEARCVEQS